jgi:hypothetical protein
MQVEEALLKLGTDPLKRSPFSNVTVAVINSYLRRENDDPVTMETPGDIALSRIYGLPISDRLLRHEVGQVRDRDTYRMTLTCVAGLVGLIVVVVALIELFNIGSSSSGQGFSVLIKLIDASLSAFEKIVK